MIPEPAVIENVRPLISHRGGEGKVRSFELLTGSLNAIGWVEDRTIVRLSPMRINRETKVVQHAATTIKVGDRLTELRNRCANSSRYSI